MLGAVMAVIVALGMAALAFFALLVALAGIVMIVGVVYAAVKVTASMLQLSLEEVIAGVVYFVVGVWGTRHILELLGVIKPEDKSKNGRAKSKGANYASESLNLSKNGKTKRRSRL